MDSHQIHLHGSVLKQLLHMGCAHAQPSPYVRTPLRQGQIGLRVLCQARDRRLVGLVEALGVVPPRPPPGGAAQPDLQQDADAAAAAAGTSGNGADVPEASGAAEGAADQAVDIGKLHAVQVTDAVWSLAVMGGPVLFEHEMEALISVSCSC